MSRSTSLSPSSALCPKRSFANSIACASCCAPSRSTLPRLSAISVGIAQHYTRNLIDKTETFELMAICWEIGQVSSIHNHRDQNCWMAVPIGRLMVQNYRVISKDLSAHRCQIEPTEQFEMNPSQPCAVDPAEPVHSVYNPREWNQRAVSLHVYSRPFDSCEVYSVEQGTCGDIRLHYTTVKGVPVQD